MVLVKVDGNFINAEPMKNRSEGSMIKAYQALWERLTASGTVKPKTHILDNKASADFKKEIQKNCTIQVVPPDSHRGNLAERAIQTFKSHFKSILARVDDSFPMQLWDRLPQAILTLTYYANPMQFQQYRRGNMSTATLTTTKHHWHQWDVRYSCTRAVRDEHHGQQIQLTDGTYRHRKNTTNATSST